MKKLPLSDLHEASGAKMIDFNGYYMPVEFSGMKEEHLNVRNHAGIFDVSHMGEFMVSGPGAFELIQRLTTNDISKLFPGKAQYTCFPNGKGGIIDDLIIYQLEPAKYMLVVNAANREKDWKWIEDNNDHQAHIEDHSGQTGLFAVQGPKAGQVLSKLTDINLQAIKPFHFQVTTLAGVKDVMVSATGYTGSGGFELYFNNEFAEKLWTEILKAGKEQNIVPVGLGARDTLRIEAGLCLYGNDIDANTSPIEAGLAWITKFNENNHFVDREYLWEQKINGIKSKLVGFKLQEKGIPRKGYEILNKQHEPIGTVTSGTLSPLLNQGIGMGYVLYNEAFNGNEIYIKIRKKEIPAYIDKFPFF